jgi:hypothetical protein
LRLRFDQRELDLILGAERLRGAAIAREGGRDELRGALQLAKAGQKVGRSSAGGTVSLDEAELSVLINALRFAAREVPQATRAELGEAPRREAAFAAFPELADKGSWRSFGLARDLEGVAARLTAALSG